MTEAAVLIGFAALYFGAQTIIGEDMNPKQSRSPAPASAARQPVSKDEAERCRVPAFAVAVGHAEKWKLHNNCK